MSITINTWIITSSKCHNYTDTFKKSTIIYDIILKYYSKQYFNCKQGNICQHCRKSLNKILDKIYIVDQNCNSIVLDNDLSYFSPSSNPTIYIGSNKFTPVLIKTKFTYYAKEFNFTFVYPRELCVQYLYDDYLYDKAISLVQKKKHEVLLFYNKLMEYPQELDKINLHQLIADDGIVYFKLTFGEIVDETSKRDSAKPGYAIRKESEQVFIPYITTDHKDKLSNTTSKSTVLNSSESEQEFVSDPDPTLEKTSTISLEGISFDELLALMKEKIRDFSAPIPDAKKISSEEIRGMFCNSLKKQNSRKKKKKKSKTGKRSNAHR